jgi:hypothetical protein
VTAIFMPFDPPVPIMIRAGMKPEVSESHVKHGLNAISRLSDAAPPPDSVEAGRRHGASAIVGDRRPDGMRQDEDCH